MAGPSSLVPRLRRFAPTLGMTVLLALGIGCAASAQQSASAITKLHRMAGAWTCAIVGTNTSGDIEHTSCFFDGGQWMEEVSMLRERGQDHSSTQIWGYDPKTTRLVAYQFTPDGVATKSVDGWVNGVFVSHRDDNGATVTIVPKGPKAFDWVIVSKDQTYTVREECKR